MSVSVSTKQALQAAMDRRPVEIVVTGDLAKRIYVARKAASLGPVALGALGAAVAVMPVTGGTSAVAAAPGVAVTGLEIAAIAAVVSVGFALVSAIFKGYEVADYREGYLSLRRKA